MEAVSECTGGTRGTIVGVWIFDPLFTLFAPKLAFSDEDIQRPEFKMKRAGVPVVSAAAKAYLWRKREARREQEEIWEQLERNAYDRKMNKLLQCLDLRC